LDRLPTHDLDAEESVLGSILIDDEAIFKVAPTLRPEDFYREKNGWIYAACLSLQDRNEAINQVTVAYELTHQDRLESVGGPAYLSTLVANVPTSIHVEHYAGIVQSTAQLRRLISAAGRIAQIAYEGGPDVDSILGQAEELLFGLRRSGAARDFVHIREILDRYFEETAFGGEDEEAGHLASIPTGFLDLDKMLGGLQRSDLIILAARPSMGKSSFAMNIAATAAIQNRARVAVFSLEMSKEQIGQRLLSSEAGVDSQRLRLNLANDAEQRRILEATGVLSEAPIWIDDSPLIKLTELRSKARRLASERGLDLIVVDYLQLIQGSLKNDNRVQEISLISRSLKALARELNVPLLALSQLSRAVETRTPHVPLLSDLRESGSIEQDADVVMFIYRDDVYYSPKEWEKQYPTKPYPKGIADIIVAKHRNGPTGQISLLFFNNTTKFVNLEIGRE
jgi:replicative DNA helicase